MLYYHDLCVCGYHIRAIIHLTFLFSQYCFRAWSISLSSRDSRVGWRRSGPNPGIRKNGRTVGCVIVFVPHSRYTDAGHPCMQAVKVCSCVCVCETLPACLELSMTVSRRAAPLSKRGTLWWMASLWCCQALCVCGEIAETQLIAQPVALLMINQTDWVWQIWLPIEERKIDYSTAWGSEWEEGRGSKK